MTNHTNWTVDEGGWACLNRLAWTSLFSSTLPLMLYQMQKQIPVYRYLKSYSSTVHPPEGRSQIGRRFLFPGRSKNGRHLCSGSNMRDHLGHSEVAKNPEKPNYLSWDSRLEPSLSSTRPMPVPLNCAAFHHLGDKQNWKQMSSPMLRESQPHCIGCLGLGHLSSRVPSALAVNSSQGQ